MQQVPFASLSLRVIPIQLTLLPTAILWIVLPHSKVPELINLKTIIVGVMKEVSVALFLNTGRIGKLKLIQRVEVFIYQYFKVPDPFGLVSKSAIQHSATNGYWVKDEWRFLTRY